MVAIFKKLKSPTLLGQIAIKWILVDSSRNALQFWFWVRRHRTDRSSTNPQKPRDGGAISILPPEFADERFVLSTWTQKTFDRAFKELSNGVKFN